jgi:hypothetical protein
MTDLFVKKQLKKEEYLLVRTLMFFNQKGKLNPEKQQAILTNEDNV